MMFSLSLTADDVGCDLPVIEPVSFHGPITVSATEASLLLDPEHGMLYLQNSDTTSALDSLGANWSRVCLSRALNHGALWHIVFLRLRNILTYLLTYLLVSSDTNSRNLLQRPAPYERRNINFAIRRRAVVWLASTLMTLHWYKVK